MLGFRGSGGQPRRVLLVGPGPTVRGGIAEFNTELTQVLRAAGDDARVLAYRRTYPRFSRAGRQAPDPSSNRPDVPASSVLVPWLPWTWIRAGRAFRRHRPDLVVIQWWHPILAASSWYIARRAKAQGARVIFVCHNAVPHEPFPLARALTKVALAAGSSLIALSEGVADDLRALLPSRRVDVVEHPSYSALAAPDDEFEARLDRWRARLGVPAESHVVLFFGNVRPYKGLADLVEAFAVVARETNAVLVVAGTFFEPLETYERQAAALGIEKIVRFVPEYIPNEDVGPLFSLCDLVALPYRSASQSGVVPLAAAYAKPVVATDVGGLAAALSGTGRVVPPHSPAVLGEAIVSALRSPPPPPPGTAGTWEAWREALG